MWLISAIFLLLTAKLVPGFKIKSFGSALLAALAVGLLNIFLRPLLIFLTLPINILTLGLFTFVVNAIIFKLAAKLLDGFQIDGWFAAVIGAIVLSLIQSVFYLVF